MTTAPTVLSGPQLRDLFAAAGAWLERHVEQVNAINVFPVPDGDTGTNMYLTMRSTLEEAQRCQEEGVAAMLAAMSHGALMGARGNSGVILSQIIRGLARAAGDARTMNGEGLVRGMDEGSQAAYKAVTKPAEGTILTVMRETAEAARKALDGGRRDIVGLLEVAVVAAGESVARTPTLLPVLAEAGVVDAGGQGLFFLLQGMLKHLKGEPLEVGAPAAEERVGREWLAVTEQLHETEESLYGYCTEILVGGRELEPDTIRERMLALGDSVLVVGDDQMVRVHVHTNDPGAALSHGTSAGSLLQVKVDNIRQQADRFLELHEARAAPAGPEPQPEAISVVAVAAGEGLAAVFRSMGCTRVVSGGPTMNPSTRDILEAVEACPAGEVIVLPNDKNIIMAAEQAVEVTNKRLKVVPTRSIPQGIAALLALNQDVELEANARVMDEARQGVRTVEVCRAVRSTSLRGVKVAEGQIIAIVDDELKLAAVSAEEAVLKAVEDLCGEGTSLITLYYGADTLQRQAEALAEDLRGRYPDHEVEVVFGGQPHYQYLASVE
ncbi:MAG TPA: DAK2 domain-containing protein [Dehalococcoidia bacterium]|nr:DAK2 domain-containing protein [Dehalococcoidia bacterium]